jgi:putative transposase
MSYSQDFRELVVKKIHEGMSRSEAEKLFNISRDSIFRWLKMHSKTGNLSDPKRKPYKPKKIDPVLLREAFEKTPDATLEEISRQFNCWPQAIYKRCIKLNITRKKNNTIRRAK